MNWTRTPAVFHSWVPQAVCSALHIAVLHVHTQRYTEAATIYHIRAQLAFFLLLPWEICLDFFQQTHYQGTSGV